ncbi:MAG: N-acetyl-gamma-glutamyl-phosphate reductase [Verrucomicrobiota bacterium]
MQAPYAVFVDGSEGTTGLEILKYLKERPDLRLLKIDPESRKDLRARAALHNQADISILCLPDAASREILPLITNPETVIIDASTAFRTASGWVFGLPELTSGQRDKIRSAKRISNAGCHATGYLLLVRPLVDAGILPRDARLTATSLTGYSGGGKKMIKQFESDPGEHLAACPYAISMQHKHLPEMQKWSGLDNAPAFLPTVARFYRGMVVTVPIHADQFSDKSLSADAITEVYQRHFAGEPFIKVYPANDAEFASAGLVDPTACAHTQRADIAVSGTGHEHFLLSCRIDNLCKGASGAAVQSLNIVTGSAEGTGLVA